MFLPREHTHTLLIVIFCDPAGHRFRLQADKLNFLQVDIVRVLVCLFTLFIENKLFIYILRMNCEKITIEQFVFTYVYV